MAPRPSILMSSRSKKKEPRYVYLSEAKASHSHKMWTEVFSSVPHFLLVGLLHSPVIYRCLLNVLCPVSRPITILDCVLLKDSNQAPVARSGPEINSQVCLCVLQVWYYLTRLKRMRNVSDKSCRESQNTHFTFNNSLPLKADSHIACRAHAVPLPCRAAKGLECVFPIWFTQCGRVWFTLAMPRPCHALTMPFFARPRHSAAIEMACGLPAFGFFRLPCGVPRKLLSESYRSQMRVASTKPNDDHGRGKAYYFGARTWVLV
jgi:hypothetical protein